MFPTTQFWLHLSLLVLIHAPTVYQTSQLFLTITREIFSLATIHKKGPSKILEYTAATSKFFHTIVRTVQCIEKLTKYSRANLRHTRNLAMI